MKKVITESEIIKLIKDGKKELLLSQESILTPLAKDRIYHSGIKIILESEKKNDTDRSTTKSFSKSSNITIGSDHTGYKIKEILKEFLKEKGYQIIDVGAFSEKAVDYPDSAIAVVQKVLSGEADFGILLDATGIPSAITANKFAGIRAATCYNEFSARSSREHNNANIIVMGAKTLGEETIKGILNAWLVPEFLGQRHQKRLDKITAIEEKLIKN
ncbi:MAG: ribose 5-phosphate isomerase B [Melioribacteraceae bacterium]|nr:ribose 5-phosphate isomerase B [Melioribacteraceae bacterium]